MELNLIQKMNKQSYRKGFIIFSALYILSFNSSYAQQAENPVEPVTTEIIQNSETKNSSEEASTQKKEEAPVETASPETAPRKKSGVVIADDEDQKPKKQEKLQLRTNEMEKQYLDSTSFSYTFFDRLFIGFLYGAVSGGAIGSGVGLYAYDSTQKDISKNNIYKFAGILGGVGATTGIVTAVIETIKDKPFKYGAGLFENSWYGAIAGALVGGVAGAIPYSSSGNSDDILKYTGVGVMAGVSAGWLAYFLLPKNYQMIYIDFDQYQTRAGIKYLF